MVNGQLPNAAAPPADRKQAAELSSWPIVPILRKYASHSRRIWTKTSDHCEQPFQASLLLLDPMRQKKQPRAGIKGRVMMFLLRAAFWLSLVVVLLPSGPQPATSGPQLGAADAMSAATAAVSDMRQFCGRQPEACTVGSQAAVAFGQKAQAGAKMLYEFLTEKIGPSETGSITPAGGKKAIMAGSSQNTLLPEDLAPAWRGPEPRKEASLIKR
jgi:hypothetical protein